MTRSFWSQGRPLRAKITLRQDELLITITADGSVAVEGQTFDFDIGRIKMKISAAEVKSLIRGFEQIGYLSLKDQYRGREDECSDDGWTHCTLIIITTSLTLKGASKSVTRYPYECLEKDGSSYPRALVALEQQIKEVIDLKKR